MPTGAGTARPAGRARTRGGNYQRSCSRAYSDTYAKYRNGVFCATIDAHSEHRKTWFEGRPRGGYYWSYSVEKWGGCSGLLQHEYILTTP